MLFSLINEQITNIISPGNLLVAGAISTSLFSIFCSNVANTTSEDISGSFEDSFKLYLKKISRSVMFCSMFYCLSLFLVLSHILLFQIGDAFSFLVRVSFYVFYISTIILLINFAAIIDFNRGLRLEMEVKNELDFELNQDPV